jgi:tRNA pseudouridine38-40 synthase
MRYKIELSYSGKEFNGWQKQPNAPSVQQTIEDACLMLFKQKIDLVGCGRTDTGVHAKNYVAHFDSDYRFGGESTNKLNRYLPKSIVINSIMQAIPDFHARFDAKSRTYEYIITTQKNPFLIDFAWHIAYDLNIDLMLQAALKLYDYADFTSFSKLHTNAKTNNCKIFNVEINPKGTVLVVRITADRFLRNMVRAIVGTIVDVGRGKISVEQFCRIIENKNRGDASRSAPAQALFLVEVEY